MGALFNPYFTEVETEAQRGKNHTPKVTQLLSGWAGTGIEAVWLQSLSTKLPLCAFRLVLGHMCLASPSTSGPLSSKASWPLVLGTRSGPDKCKLEVAPFLGSGFRASVHGSDGDLPSAVISWPDMSMETLLCLQLERTWKK